NHLVIKKVEKAKEELLFELSQANSSKDRLFSLISHDLRSPLTPIIGNAEFIVDCVNELSKEQIKTFAQSIVDSSKKLSDLLESLLEWSKVQMDSIEFEPQQLE